MKNRVFFALAFVFFGVILGSMMFGSAPSVHQPERQERDGPTNTLNHNENASSSSGATANKEESGLRKTEGENDSHITDWLIAVFNGFLVIVTWRLVTTTSDLRASTDKLWLAGERQIEAATATAERQFNDMEASLEIGRRNADAARMAAEAAQDNVRASWDATGAAVQSLKVMKDTAERQLRAYLGVHQIDVQGLETNDRFAVQFKFENYGQTPALKFNIVGAVDLLPFPLPDDFIIPEPPARPKQDGIIFPKEQNPMTGWVFEDDANRMAIETKRQILRVETPHQIYAHGAATYEDVFGKVRHTKFCYYLNHLSVVRNAQGILVRNKLKQLQYQWSPVAGRNGIV